MNIDLSKMPSVYCPLCGREAKLEQMTVKCEEGHSAWVGGVSASNPSDWRLGMAAGEVASWFKAGRVAALRVPWRSNYPAGHVGNLRVSHQPPALYLNLGPETQVLVLPEHVEPVAEQGTTSSRASWCGNTITNRDDYQPDVPVPTEEKWTPGMKWL